MRRLILFVFVLLACLLASAQYRDDFNRTDGNLGANWKGTDIWVHNNAATTNNGDVYSHFAYWIANSFMLAQYARLKVGAIDSRWSAFGPAVRVTSDNRGYAALWHDGNVLTLRKINSISLWADLVPNCGTVATGDTVALHASGRSPTMLDVYVNGGLACQYTDWKAPFIAGSAGMHVRGGGAGTGDDWQGGSGEFPASPALSIITTSLPDSQTAIPYVATAKIVAIGGILPYTFSVESGALPRGLKLDVHTGVISGTPKVANTFRFTVQVRDRASATAARTYTIVVQEPTTDIYGGALNLPCSSTGNGYFHIEKFGGRLRVCTPAAHAYYTQGVFLVNYADSTDPFDTNNAKVVMNKYGSVATWAAKTAQRLKSWGFNAIGINSSAAVWPISVDPSYPLDAHGLHSIPIKLAFTNKTYTGAHALRNTDITTVDWKHRSALDYNVKTLTSAWSPLYRGWRGVLSDMYDPGLYKAMGWELANDRFWAYDLVNSPYREYLLGIAVDDGDWLYGLQTNPDFSVPDHTHAHPGWLVMTGSPVLSVGIYGSKALYFDTQVKSKRAFRDMLAAKYGANPNMAGGTSGKALNSEWHSTYTSLDSTGTPRKGEWVGTPNGSVATFTHRLAYNTASLFSVQILVNDTPVAGEYLQNPTVDPDHPTIWGPNVNGTIQHSTGDLSLTFATGAAIRLQSLSTDGSLVTARTDEQQHGLWPGAKITIAGTKNYDATGVNVVSVPDSYHFTYRKSGGFLEETNSSGTVTLIAVPQTGNTVTVNYVQNGWRIGTGVMDEDGRHSWIGSNEHDWFQDSSGARHSSEALKADLDQFLEDFSEEYLKHCKAEIAKYNAANGTHYMFLGPDSIATWNVPTRAPVLRAAGRQIELLITGNNHPYTNAMLAFIHKNAGDLPILEGLYLSANADSPMRGYMEWPDASAPNQEARGQNYYDAVKDLQAKAYPDGIHPYVGFNYWSYLDMLGSEYINWGLVSLRDNAYDGREAVSDSVTCSPPLQDYECGGEAPYDRWQPNYWYKPPQRPHAPPGNRVQVKIDGTYYVFEATTTGRSCNSEPAWPIKSGAIAMDCGVRWKNNGIKTNFAGFGDAITKIKAANALFYGTNRSAGNGRLAVRAGGIEKP